MVTFVLLLFVIIISLLNKKSHVEEKLFHSHQKQRMVLLQEMKNKSKTHFNVLTQYYAD